MRASISVLALLVAVACVRETTMELAPAVDVPEPSPIAVDDAGALPPPAVERVGPSVAFRFPLAEFIADVDSEDDEWERLVIRIEATRRTDATTDELKLELRGDYAGVASRSSESRASSAQFQSTDAAPFRALLRACAVPGDAGVCRVPASDETFEAWDEFDFIVSFEHPDHGHFIESRDVALLFMPLVEALYGGSRDR